MTREERTRPEVINGSRRQRIAQGSGTSVAEVNRLVSQFGEMQKMMKRFGGAAALKGAKGSKATKGAKKGKKGKAPGSFAGKGPNPGFMPPGMPGLPGLGDMPGLGGPGGFGGPGGVPGRKR